MTSKTLILVLIAFLGKHSTAQYEVRTDEVFVIQLSPNLFNISDTESEGNMFSKII